MAEAAIHQVEWKGRTGPFSLHVRPGVFSPTTTSRTLADALEINPGDTVIDVGCGSGVLAFVAAKLGAGKVYGCDLSAPAVRAARENAAMLGLSDVCEFRQGDLLDPVRDVRADVLIGDVSGIPDELAAVTGWFDRVPAGGPTGAELPRKLLGSIGDTLAPGGRLYLPTGTLQDEASILTLARELFGDNMEPVLEREFPLPELVAKATATARMMKEGLLSLHKRGSRLLWSLRIWRCVRT
ncbi:MAG TPA: 50S ribosomal protein L11 methyltransferase [Actinomycetota bacterium]|jgi:SAM-dependent methyltransferase|nr:50S ribosomal protein L11 methyltransferase [Actinomycetota bacterium]